MSAHLYQVARNDVQTVWPMVERWVETAADEAHGWWTADDIRERLETGGAGLWLVIDDIPVACVVSEIETGPRFSTVVISICAGSGMEIWLHLLPQIEAWAKAIGARVIEVRGRKGWARALKSSGYAERAVIVGKELQ